jgi:hypothetical protein
MNKTINDFKKGDKVIAHPKQPDGLFMNDFLGTIRGVHGKYIIVADQDGDCWDCDPEQLEVINE